MIAFLFLFAQSLFAQSAFDPPPLGYFPARDGRVYPLYGMRGNLLIGEPLEEGVTAALRLDSVTVMKTGEGVKVNGKPVDGDALRRNRILSPRSVWIAAVQRIAEWKPRFTVALQTAGSWERVEFDGLTLAETKREHIAADAAAIDSDGRLWTASATTVTCGERTWEMEAQVGSLLALHEGWVLIRSGERLYGAQCRSADLTLVPEPAP